MRILLANKFYYRRGGDCIYTLNLEQKLIDEGHEVAVFSMQHPENLLSRYAEYFPSEVKFSPSPRLLETLRRPFGSSEVKRKFGKLLNDFKPEVVHLNNIHSQLSPIIAEMAKEFGAKVVWTLHDYKLICPRYDCRRNGMICIDCVNDPKAVKSHKCMKGSAFASIIAYKEAKKWTRQRLEAATDTFICPSSFMAAKMAEAGFDKAKLEVVSNFIEVEKCRREDYAADDYFLYFGRLSDEKGLITLVKAANQTGLKLKIAGTGPIEDDIKAIAQSNVQLVGKKNWDELKDLIGKARFTVIPSEWGENNPLSVIESLCLGVPVLGAEIGGIPELITATNGMTFRSGDVDQLASKISEMYNGRFDRPGIAAAACELHNADRHYKSLCDIYNRR